MLFAPSFPGRDAYLGRTRSRLLFLYPGTYRSDLDLTPLFYESSRQDYVPPPVRHARKMGRG